jgi:hypothetical protein
VLHIMTGEQTTDICTLFMFSKRTKVAAGRVGSHLHKIPQVKDVLLLLQLCLG